MTTLEHYQLRLAALLDAAADPEAIRKTLLEDPELSPLRAYVEAMDDRALQVAVQLRRRWGN